MVPREQNESRDKVHQLQLVTIQQCGAHCRIEQSEQSRGKQMLRTRLSTKNLSRLEEGPACQLFLTPLPAHVLNTQGLFNQTVDPKPWGTPARPLTVPAPTGAQLHPRHICGVALPPEAHEQIVGDQSLLTLSCTERGVPAEEDNGP